ncbi:hypothetical protein H2199_004958 [Coniosporium tulheliwenetii]|uniref:Uncharacterized protein n=1 Tax=Coniosporium tulheliwenetii TaxID=3383036 RepID=A0ACC2Z4C4_9PEZI|nr:hypothetical protein H2199_004958 [Cladosporium sp. JES 115]
MVRRITFADGISWVARLRLPELNGVFGGRDALDNACALKIEIASMKFFKSKTSIPVPEVYSYNVDPTNDVGAPYILMDYIHGTVAIELRMARNGYSDLFGTPDQDQRFRQQTAKVQATLSSFKFDQIGSLYQNEETLEFFIGLDLKTGKGPGRRQRTTTPTLHFEQSKSDVQESPSFTVPVLFKHLISLYGDNGSR